jgi:hypothetical protein
VLRDRDESAARASDTPSLSPITTRATLRQMAGNSGRIR